MLCLQNDVKNINKIMKNTIKVINANQNIHNCVSLTRFPSKTQVLEQNKLSFCAIKCKSIASHNNLEYD